MPDLRPLLAPDSIAVIGASADGETLRGRLTRALIGHGYPGRVYPVTRSQGEVLGLQRLPHGRRSAGSRRSRGDPGAGGGGAATLERMRPPRHPRRNRHQLRALPRRAGEAAQARDSELRPIAERHGILVCGPNSEGLVNPLRTASSRPSARCFTTPSAACCRTTPAWPADRGQLPERRLDLRLFQPRARPAIAFHLSGQRRQPDDPRGA